MKSRVSVERSCRGDGDNARQSLPFGVALGEPCGVSGANGFSRPGHGLRSFPHGMDIRPNGIVEEQGDVLFQPLIALERERNRPFWRRSCRRFFWVPIASMVMIRVKRR